MHHTILNFCDFYTLLSLLVTHDIQKITDTQEKEIKTKSQFVLSSRHSSDINLSCIVMYCINGVVIAAQCTATF